VWERIATAGFPAVRSEVQTIAVLWLMCVAAYVTARVLKKTGQLGRG